MNAEYIAELARGCGFELAGVAAAEPSPDAARYHQWVDAGCAGAMGYLTDRRAQVRDHPRNLLASARSMVCVGKLYNTPLPYSTALDDSARAWISRYAWGADYHDTVRSGLERLDGILRAQAGAAYESKICVDTAPLLERSYARAAGLGWIGKNTCLINQSSGSWFFLGEILTSLEIAPGLPPPDRCGSCTRCIDACPTDAIGANGYQIDARQCISYFTIELRGPIPETWRAAMGNNIFGCDICQDVCPWNRSAPVTTDSAYAARNFAPPLAQLAAIGEAEFRELYRHTPISRARYSGFLRNVAVAMGAQGREEFRVPLEKLASLPDAIVAEHARWALAQL